MTETSTGSLSQKAFAPIAGTSGMSYAPLLELGEGGMSKVFLARASGPGGFAKLVVLKTLRRSGLANPSARQMFLDEARLSARLNHPNLVQVHALDLDAEPPYLVMEHLDGKPLSELRGCDRVTQQMWLTMVSDMLSGLHYAHELRDFDGTPLNIVHRDVSPRNVIVTYDGAVKVLDFGIAKTAQTRDETQTGEIKGTLTYMAPEQLSGDEVDRRADLFSVGSLLWEIATGRRMWEGLSEATLMLRLVNGEVPRPSEHRRLDPELERIILRATASDPSDRYSSALELRQDLDRLIDRDGGRASVRAIGETIAAVFAADRERSAVLVNDALRSVAAGSAVAAAAEARGTAPRRSRALRVAVALLALGSLAAFATFRLRGSPVPPASPASAAAEVVLDVRTEPANARIEIDGEDAGQGSVVRRVREDTNEHVLRVSAPGHVAVTRVVKFDRNHRLEIALEKAPEAESADATAPLEPASEPSADPGKARATGARPRAGARGKAGTPAASNAASKPDCDPPYYFVGGIKTYKPDCL